MQMKTMLKIMRMRKSAGGTPHQEATLQAIRTKWKIKSVDVSPLSENIVNPVVFTFEIVD